MKKRSMHSLFKMEQTDTRKIHTDKEKLYKLENEEKQLFVLVK